MWIVAGEAGVKREIDSSCVRHPFIFFRVQDSYRRLGSPTVSAVGSHAAMVRYIPTIETNKRITDKEIYRLNAATQYKGTCKPPFFFSCRRTKCVRIWNFRNPQSAWKKDRRNRRWFSPTVFLLWNLMNWFESLCFFLNVIIYHSFCNFHFISDGSTTMARTIHIGKPTDKEIDSFTRVLKGFISVATSIFPPNAPVCVCVCVFELDVVVVFLLVYLFTHGIIYRMDTWIHFS